MRSFGWIHLTIFLCCSFIFDQTMAQSPLKIHTNGEQYKLDITDSLLGRDILVVNRVAKGFSSGDQAIYAGDKISSNLVRFHKDEKGRIVLLSINNNLRSADSSANGMFRSVSNSSSYPVSFVFETKRLNNNNGFELDLTPFLNQDNEFLALDKSAIENWQLGSYLPAESQVLNGESFRDHFIVRTRRTYSKKSGGNLTIELASTFLILSKEPMRPRFSDRRVGYFTTSEFIDFDASQQGTTNLKMITRWKLEPKPADVEKYLKGELVEPQKPIVFYIDPATPAKWIPYFMKGVSDWQPAFEKAGFKNAIYARLAPTKEEDPSWSLESSAFSNIVYMASPNEDASYSTIVDPRSGEILGSHIRWFHNAMQLLHKWYFVQAAPNDPAARKEEYDDELMGELMRYVMAHEVGHALGFPHNFISSNSTPVEKLRDKKWVESKGHTPSIMDYARFNYVAQPGDKISRKGIFPRIGEYDKWAIEWGYRWLPNSQTRQEEKNTLDKWISVKNNERRYWYGGEGLNDDPRSQFEDLSNDIIKANEYGIKNLKYIVANLPAWTKGSNADYIRQKYSDIFFQFITYLNHVADNIGGIYESPKPGLEEVFIYQAVPEEYQKRSLRFLNDQFFITPKWLLSEQIFSITGEAGINKLTELQSRVLFTLLNAKRIGNLIASWTADSNAYSPKQYLTDLNQYIFAEAYQNKPVDAYRRSLQHIYMDLLERLFKQPVNRTRNPSHAEIPMHISNAAASLKITVEGAMTRTKDEMTLQHYQQLVKRLVTILNPPAK